MPVLGSMQQCTVLGGDVQPQLTWQSRVTKNRECAPVLLHVHVIPATHRLRARLCTEALEWRGHLSSKASLALSSVTVGITDVTTFTTKASLCDASSNNTTRWSPVCAQPNSHFQYEQAFAPSSSPKSHSFRNRFDNPKLPRSLSGAQNNTITIPQHNRSVHWSP